MVPVGGYQVEDVGMLNKKKFISIKLNESRLKERNRELYILLEISSLISTSMGLEDLLTAALSKVLKSFDVDAGRIYLMDEERQYLYLVAHLGLDPEGLEKVHINEGFSGKAARTKSFIAQHISELEDKDRAAFLLRKGFMIIICVPLIAGNKVVGVMNLAARKVIELDQGEIDLLTTIGHQIAIAVNNGMLYGELQSKIEKLKERKEMIKFFAYTISHDLRSPAISIHGLTKRLQEKYTDSLDEKGKAYCAQILQTSQDMIALVEDINAYIGVKEVPLHLDKIKVKEIIRSIRNELSVLLDQRQIRWLEPDRLPELKADTRCLSRAFRNLVDNALKYGGEGLSEIKIGYEEDEASHIFSISDDGVGIRNEDKEKIFGIFQRNETSRGTTGSGLGLAIVKEIAERHGGNAWMDCSVKKGTRVCVSISKKLGTS
jgi:K+-sensing histidine kinase KdpD